jgi:CRP-like cAMP-binding protein
MKIQLKVPCFLQQKGLAMFIEPESLQKYSLFGGLLTEQIAAIISLMEEERYEPGSNLSTEGERCDKLRFIVEGKVTVTKAGHTLAEFAEGNMIGEMEFLDVMPCAATVRALVPTRALSISHRGLREIYRSDIKVFSLLVMNLARDLSRRLRRMDEIIAGEPCSAEPGCAPPPETAPPRAASPSAR